MLRIAPALTTLLVTASGLAQIHTRDPLILGQPARLDFAGMPTSSIGAVMFGFGGAGSGTCFPPPFNLCFGVLDPILFSGTIPSDLVGSASLALTIPSTSMLFPVATQGLWLDLSTPTLTLVTTNTEPGGIESLAYYNESFDGDGIRPDWQFLNQAQLDFGLVQAELNMTPLTAGPGGSWGDDSTGPLIYREIYGDFSVTTTARAFDPSTPAQTPQPLHRLGGLMIRNPASGPGQRDWVAIGIGGGTASIPLAITALDTFGTTTAYSYFNQTGALSPDQAQLRLVRTGDQIACEYRNNPVVAFATLATVTRPNLPDPIQVGMFVSSGDAPPNVTLALTNIRWSN